VTVSSTIDAGAVEATARQSNRVHPRSSDLHVVHVTSSRFFGGPERQMLELAREVAPHINSSFISFSEGRLCEDFLGQVRRAGFTGVQLKHDTPRLVRAVRELRSYMLELGANVLCVHGYKAGLLGLLIGRKLGIPVVGVSRGWTAENWKVRLYERLDRLALRHMDHVVCVSHGQCDKVRRAGVAPAKLSVIHNAVRPERFRGNTNGDYRGRLVQLFGQNPPPLIFGAAGRLSPEKGFDLLITAFSMVKNQRDPDVGLVLFGGGPLREDLRRQIDAAQLGTRFILAGFTSELDRFMPHFDAFVQSSHTEGLPNVLLEAAAAGVPVVATDVGGTRELVVNATTGLIVPANDPQALAAGVHRLLRDDALRATMKQQAQQHVARHFTFAGQAEAYCSVFEALVASFPNRSIASCVVN
jgi:glycosyltransferase involved in cell wall biosynthesis